MRIVLFSIVLLLFTACSNKVVQKEPHKGVRHYTGDNAAKNPKKIFKHYNKRTHRQNIEAMFNAGYNYYKGTGRQKDVAKALELLSHSNLENHAPTLNVLGLIYDDKKEYEKANFYFERSAILGNFYAAVNLGHNYLDGNGVEKNMDMALHWYNIADTQRDHISDKYENFDFKRMVQNLYFNQGHIYEFDKNDIAIAIKKYEIAYGYKSAKAAFNLAIIYEKGKTGSVEKSKAIKWYKKAIELGHEDAMYNLGVLYYKNKEYKSAIEYFSMASDNNQPLATTYLGVMYTEGQFVEKDYKKAIYYYESAELNKDSANNIANLYILGGYGIEKNVHKAIYYYKKAAKLGNSLSAMLLMKIYSRHKIVELTLYWLLEAVKLGNEEAIKLAKQFYQQSKDQGLSRDTSPGMYRIIDYYDTKQ